MVLPKINSTGRKGVTMICSMVPSSFSRTTDMAVRFRVLTMMTRAMIPGT